ncbi:hypothetical protein MYX64_02245 [Nitrospinae bacterium AH_259_B05_G02_I21]|nr:hypothetical protein [Nitrospinae bacterium AH_259_B05_G02_I21]
MTPKEPGEQTKSESDATPKPKKPRATAKGPKKAKQPKAATPAAETPPPSPPPPPLVEDRRDFWDTAATYLKKAKDEVVRSSRVGKLRLDIARIRKQRKDLYAELGEKTYELLSAESLTSKALEEKKVSVDEKNALIAAKEAEIEAIAAEEAEQEEAGTKKS